MLKKKKSRSTFSASAQLFKRYEHAEFNRILAPTAGAHSATIHARHRRIVGIALLVGWAVGMVVHPGQYLLYPAICGIITLFSIMDSASK
ncbi:hypothetical protein [Pseudomonas helmanticensis]|uniref:hypothetical protein n=1 Tax=Pseudomonas helmanticensis TaxID=1471381 RepID=UPI0024B865E5|nr:hypothetical protein [Pseudomonas helmanticensis]